MIAEQIFDWANRMPNRTAIIHNGRPFSYRAFAQLIARARGYFVRRDCIGPGCAVLAIDNLMHFWVISLALRSLGLTTITLPPTTTVGELGLPDMRFVVTSGLQLRPDLEGMCAAHQLKLLMVSLEGETALELGAPEAVYPTGGHILRTSGTTGASKMVLMSPGIDNVFLRRKAQVIGMDSNTLLCVFGYQSWTATGYRWAASPWTVGGAILIEQGREWYRALKHPGITHAVLVPANLARVLAAPADAFPRNDAMQLIVGGGAMTRRQVEQAKARVSSCLFNWLASTEAGGIALTRLDTPDDLRCHRLVPDRVVEIVDECDRLLPAGETGGIRIGTEGGPTSYLHDEATTRTFFKDGYFYPGDLALMRSDGRMALQGRSTDVINLRGIKVSAAPVEDKLCDTFGATGVCLFSMQNEYGEEDVHVVLETQSPVEHEQLITQLRQALGNFGNAHVHLVSSLPRNAMGKILRQAVRAQVLAKEPPPSPMNVIAKPIS